MRECDADLDAWTFGRATAFAFSIVTVLGFGTMQVLTVPGKVSFFQAKPISKGALRRLSI